MRIRVEFRPDPCNERHGAREVMKQILPDLSKQFGTGYRYSNTQNTVPQEIQVAIWPNRETGYK